MTTLQVPSVFVIDVIEAVRGLVSSSSLVIEAITERRNL